MIVNAIKKVFGTKNDREIKRMNKFVQKINVQEDELVQLSDQALAAKTEEFKKRLSEGESVDDLLPEAFAVVREAGKRVMGMRHFDVQMLGGISLHEGNISEMRTGEGKTFVATLPVYLNALSGKGVHVVTVNDYLASRDAQWMQPLYEFLGLSVGTILSGQDGEQKRQAYTADITYGTNNEFGFDYLRDNMAFSLEEKVQRGLHFAIVDEVDSILIDEARTPLIISGQAEDSSALYKKINTFIPFVTQAEMIEEHGEQHPGPGHFTLDEKQRQVEFTEEGHEFVEGWLLKEGLLKEGDSLYSAGNLKLLHHVTTALRAHVLFNKDVDYIVQDKQVVLIDEHTGRTMAGRRLSEGLHQALEAKEGVNIQAESQTLASTTFQNYFRLYEKLGGMTGTADTEAGEFLQIYGLHVRVIPTNKPVVRKDQNDLVFLSQEEKFEAIVKDIKTYMEQQAPILVGTASIESSEYLSAYLTKEKIKHKVLNAKFHEQEAQIVAEAGRPCSVTIATNMAGRGTDIVLGGNLEVELAALDNPSEQDIAALREDWGRRHQTVLDAGGLHILGTERHESRRIDNQLRGRAGRQGDPGVTRFYLSLEDSLMRIFASDRVKNFMQALGMERGEAIEHRMVTNAIEKAQRKVEGRNFDIRKQLLEYDDVASDQRRVVYQQRADLLEADNVSEVIEAIREDVVTEVVASFIPPQSIDDQWDIPGLEQHIEAEFGMAMDIQQWLKDDKTLSEAGVRAKVLEELGAAYQQKCEQVGEEIHRFEKHIMLQVLDGFWKEHLASMDHLRQGIHLRGYAGKNPKQEYKRESFELFEEMLGNIKHEVVNFLAKVQIRQQEEIDEAERVAREEQARLQKEFQHAQADGLSGTGSAEGESDASTEQPFVRNIKKVGRNEPCPCGSGKKYKQCHGTLG